MARLIPPSVSSIPVVVEAENILREARARIANVRERELRVTPIAPVIVIVAVAVVAFIALAAAIGALAAYIWFCHSNGLGWPGLSVPGSSGGVYKLACFK